MNSLRLVLLSLVVGIAIGAGLMAARQNPVSGDNTADAAPSAPPEEITGKTSGAAGGARSTPEDGYKRVASALLSIDERLSLMEAREEANLEKQNKLIDQVRELAIALEIKSGNLKPLRGERAPRLEPMHARPGPETAARERVVPLAQPLEPHVPLGGEELPEW